MTPTPERAAMMTDEELRALLLATLRYDPETGEVRRIGTGRRVGTKTSRGYRSIWFRGKRYREHRLIWLMRTGKWPAPFLDHKNRVRDDNRWDNLRIATKAQQSANTKIHATNTSGYRGVHYEAKRETPRKWIAQIWLNNHTTTLGYFLSAEEASEAYEAAFHQRFGEFAGPTRKEQ